MTLVFIEWWLVIYWCSVGVEEKESSDELFSEKELIDLTGLLKDQVFEHTPECRGRAEDSRCEANVNCLRLRETAGIQSSHNH